MQQHHKGQCLDLRQGEGSAQSAERELAGHKRFPIDSQELCNPGLRSPLRLVSCVSMLAINEHAEMAVPHPHHKLGSALRPDVDDCCGPNAM